WIKREKELIQDVHISIGPAGPKPFRAHQAEALLRGQKLQPALIEQAKQAILSEAHFRTSPHRATADYRQHLTGVLLQETLELAWQRAIEG
ncbi:MAG: hypothetical protein ACPL4H_08235, partial [Anaerolineales bacterium]